MQCGTACTVCESCVWAGAREGADGKWRAEVGVGARVEHDCERREAGARKDERGLWRVVRVCVRERVEHARECVAARQHDVMGLM
jgi:hypothetical protein